MYIPLVDEEDKRPPLKFGVRSTIAGWFSPTYAVIRKWKKACRFYGWKWGILTGAIAASIVLIMNIAFVIVGTTKEYKDGMSTLFVGSSSRISNLNTGLHLLINICSTLLLSASNYAMQVLSSPTRTECDAAHERGSALNIGVLSITNVRSISRKRKLLWLTLALSSIPLHLL